MSNRRRGVKPTNKAEPHGRTGPYMYVGPTVNGIGIQNRVYSEIPDGAAEKIKADVELGFLFIPIGDYPVANRMIREQDGYIYNAFTKALQYKNRR